MRILVINGPNLNLLGSREPDVYGKRDYSALVSEINAHAAKLGIEVLDCGIPVLSMHSPFEVISKVDLFIAYKGYLAFLNEG
jgi:hypothetical protein